MNPNRSTPAAGSSLTDTGPHMPFVARPGCALFWSWHQLSNFISEIMPGVQCISISFHLHWPGGASSLTQRPSLLQGPDLNQHGVNRESAVHRFKGEGRLRFSRRAASWARSRQKAGTRSEMPGEPGKCLGSSGWRLSHSLQLWWARLTLDSRAETVYPFSILYLSRMSVSLDLKVLSIDRRGVRLGEGVLRLKGAALLHPPCCQVILFLLINREMMGMLYLPRNTSKFPTASTRGEREWWQAFSTYFNWQSHN